MFRFVSWLFLEQKLAGDEFAALHPDDADAANKAFVGFTGLFGQVHTIQYTTKPHMRWPGVRRTILSAFCHRFISAPFCPCVSVPLSDSIAFSESVCTAAVP